MKQSRIDKKRVKKKPIKQATTSTLSSAFRHTINQILLLERLKAFITDIFMIYMPILYIATYVVLGSKEAFQDSQITLFVCFVLYAMILSIFFTKKSQTLGYMYAEIALIKDSDVAPDFNQSHNLLESKDSKVSFLRSICRFVLFCISMSLVFGLFVPFMRKDRKTFHDLICNTRVVKYAKTTTNHR